MAVGVVVGVDPVLGLEGVVGGDVVVPPGVVVPDGVAAGLDAVLVPEAVVVPDAGVDAGAAPDAGAAVFELPLPPLHPAITAASSTSIKRPGRCERFMCIPLYRRCGAGGRTPSDEHASAEQKGCRREGYREVCFNFIVAIDADPHHTACRAKTPVSTRFSRRIYNRVGVKG